MVQVNLPDVLQPTGVEVFCATGGSEIQVPKATPAFSLWRGEPIINDRGRKPVLDWEGEPLFAELVILRLLESKGWEGVWVDTYGRANRRSLYDSVPLPEKASELVGRIRNRAGKRGGCFDVFAWLGQEWLFAEVKWLGNDETNQNQKSWLQAAMAESNSQIKFLVVEWRLIQKIGQ